MRNRIISFRPGVSGLHKKASEYLNDTERFSVNYFETLIDGYESLRDERHKDSWDLGVDFYDPRGSGGSMGWRDSLAGIRVDLDGFMELLEIHPARVRNMIQSSEAMTLNQSPKIYATGLSPKMARLQRVFEIIANAMWQRDTSRMDMLRLCHRDAWLTGFAFAISGYWSRNFGREKWKRRQRAALAQRFLNNPLADNLADAITRQEEAGEDSIQLEPKELTFEGDERIYLDGICSKRVSPFMIVFDPDASSMHEMGWIGRAILADHDAVLADPNIDFADDIPTVAVKDIDALKGGMQKLGMPNQFAWMDKTGPYRYCVLYEVFFRNDDGGWDMKVMAKGLSDPLRHEKNVYAMGNPYSMLSWNRHGDSMFATSDFDDIKTLLLAERNALKRLHDGVMRSLLDTTILDKGIFPKAVDTEFIMTPGVGLMGYAESSPNGRSVKDGVVTLQQSRVTNEVIVYLQTLDKYFQIASGLGPNQMGMAMKSETSATEAANTDNWVKLRGGVKYAAMESFVTDISLKEMQLAAQFQDYDWVGTYAGPDAAAQWAREDFTDGDIQNGLLLKVEQGSMQPRNDQQRSQLSVQMLQMAQNPMFAPLINPIFWLKTFAEANGVMDGSDGLVNVNPSDVQKAAIQMALMGANPGGSPPSLTQGAGGVQNVEAGAA